MRSAEGAGGAVSRLDRRIVNSAHRLERAVLRAERAGVLARMGQATEAAAEIACLRAEFESCPYPEISVRLYLAEAWQAYFTDFSPEASDKIRRAYVLSRAAGLTDELALSAAWLAHMDYVSLDFHAMAEHVLEALQWASPQAHDTHGRACLVVAEAYHLAGAPECAQPWYARARQHAVAAADSLTVSAINHNMAWHRTLQALQKSLWGCHAAALQEARHALTSAAATHELDACRGTSALPCSIQVARALSHSVLGDYAEALSLYEAHAPQADAEGLLPLRPLVLADMAWCCHHLRLSELATHYSCAAVSSLGLASHADNLALAHGRLAQVLAHLADPRHGVPHRRRARLKLRAHQQLQSEVLRALAGVADWGEHVFRAPLIQGG